MTTQKICDRCRTPIGDYDPYEGEVRVNSLQRSFDYDFCWKCVGQLGLIISQFLASSNEDLLKQDKANNDEIQDIQSNIDQI